MPCYLFQIIINQPLYDYDNPNPNPKNVWNLYGTSFISMIKCTLQNIVIKFNKNMDKLLRTALQKYFKKQVFEY